MTGEYLFRAISSQVVLHLSCETCCGSQLSPDLFSRLRHNKRGILTPKPCRLNRKNQRELAGMSEEVKAAMRDKMAYADQTDRNNVFFVYTH